MKKIRPYALLFAIVLIVVIILRFVIIPNSESLTITNDIISHLTINQSELNNSKLEKVTVASVVDGDTLWVYNSTNDKIKVRLIGVNTPESVSSDKNKNCDQGNIASEYTKKELIKGKTIYLQYDKERQDKYGRVLAYIWLTDKVDLNDINNIKENMFNAILLKEGYANTMFVGENTFYKKEFTYIKNNAKNNKIGFWKNAEELEWN